ncbi:MAG: DUF502 domain-containing protein [Cytophagaceae bacterium]|nr:DUF502 domain-containing protein [Cytophagaceae bacterium]
MKKFLRYFFQGLLFVIPVALTIYIIVATTRWIDNLIDRLFGVDLPTGVGFVIVVSIVTVIGYLGSTLIAKPAFTVFENFLYKLPIINLIYSSTKDIMGAFVGDKKKFNQPVLVKVNKEYNIQRLGFITQNDLKILEIQDKVAVYFPHSYNISGNLFIVPREHITIIHAPSSEVMKFIVSGGVSGLNH